MLKKLSILLLATLLASPVYAAEGFTWAHLLLGWMEQPLLNMGIDPLPILDLLVVALLLIILAFVGGKPFRKSELLEPSGKISLSHVLEVVVGGLLNFLSGIIRHGVGAKPILPLLGTYALFILGLNLIGAVPGFNPPTDQFNVTITFGVIIFVVTHFLGIKVHGAHYIKQFLGPVWWLSPLMFVIELVSHMVRPLSLAIRLFGNMTGDHKVVFVFTSILAVGLPIPFMGLGLLVAFLQSFVFVVLSSIYFESAMAEAH